MKHAIKGNKVKSNVSSIVNVLLLLLVICTACTASALSGPVQLCHREERQDKFVEGATVYMLFGGIDAIERVIHVNDTLAIHRISPSCEVTQIGIIRVVSLFGETYLKGAVFAEEIKPDDIAKGKCLVPPNLRRQVRQMRQLPAFLQSVWIHVAWGKEC